MNKEYNPLSQSAFDTLNKEWSFLTGIGTLYLPEDDSNEAKITALFKNQQDLRSRIDTLRTRILDLERRIGISEKRQRFWWNR